MTGWRANSEPFSTGMWIFLFNAYYLLIILMHLLFFSIIEHAQLLNWPGGWYCAITWSAYIFHRLIYLAFPKLCLFSSRMMRNALSPFWFKCVLVTCPLIEPHNVEMSKERHWNNGFIAVLQCWILYHLVALGNLLDGVCNSTYSQRTKEFWGYNFIDNLFATLGFFYLSEVVYLTYFEPQFCWTWLHCISWRFSWYAQPSRFVVSGSQLSDSGLLKRLLDYRKEMFCGSDCFCFPKKGCKTRSKKQFKQ